MVTANTVDNFCVTIFLSVQRFESHCLFFPSLISNSDEYLLFYAKALNIDTKNGPLRIIGTLPF